MKKHILFAIFSTLGTTLFAAEEIVSKSSHAAEGEMLPTLYPFSHDGKWGYIDATGAWVIEPQFGRCIEIFERNRVRVWQDKLWGYIDRHGKWIVEPRFNDPYLGKEDAAFEVVYTGKKQGILSRSGQLVLPVEYDDIELSEDRAWVRNGEKLGVFALDGRWILKPSIKWPRGRSMPVPTDGGTVSWFSRGQKWGLLSRDGKVLFEPQFVEHEMGRHEAEEWDHPEGLDFKDHRAWVTNGKDYLLISNEGEVLARQPFVRVGEWTDRLYIFTSKDGKQGLISTHGDVVLTAQFHEIKPVVEGRAVVVQREDRRNIDGGTDPRWHYGYLDEQGRMVVEPRTYSGPGVPNGGQTELAPFAEGLAPVWNNSPEKTQGHVYDPCAGYIDRDGALVIAKQFYRTEPFSEGLGPVQERKPRKGLSHEGGLWGYVDKTGALAIKPQFGAATPFYRNRAWVLKAGARWDEAKWAMIDRTGNVLTDFAYEPPERRTGWLYKESERLAKTRWRGDFANLTRYDFHNGLASADGKVLVEPHYSRIGEFHDGVAVATDTHPPDDKGNVKFITLLLTERGEILANGTYTEISDFDGGVAWTSHRRRDRGHWQDEGWGLIDTTAREICELKYVKAWWVWSRDDSYTGNQCPRFYGELAPVAVAAGYNREGQVLINGWGYMNRAGKIVAWQEKSPVR